MNEKKLINLTPHPITVVGEDGEVKLVIPPSGKIARVKTEQTVIGEINGIPVVKTVFGDVEGLPTVCDNCELDGDSNAPCYNPEWGGENWKTKYRGSCPYNAQKPMYVYIVSSLVAQAVKGRQDVVAPDTSPSGVVRDEQGRIIGVKRFQRW